MTATNDIMIRGMECLIESLGVIEAEHFISTVIREKFDYTVWQRQYFDAMAPGEFHDKAVKYAKAHPYNGQTERL